MKSQSAIIETIQALLAKAESSEFEEEAATFTAKAQELITRYSIEHLPTVGRANAEKPVEERFDVKAPYARGKATLLSQVARANHCTTVWMPHYEHSVVFGFASDLEMVELLYMSLLVQGAKAVAVQQPSGYTSKRAFRSSFWQAYAVRIGDRLGDATTAVEEEEENASLLPVLKRKDDEVDEAKQEAFPDARPMRRLLIASSEGWHAGTVAADNAVINHSRPIGSDEG